MPDLGARMTGRLAVGLAIIVLGLLFTLDNLGLIEADEVLSWWPIIPLAWGLMRLTGLGARMAIAQGILWTLVGGWLLLHNLDVVRFGIWDLWPVLLIALGFSMVSGAMARGRGARPGEDATAHINAFALWSGTHRKVVSQDFRGGEITAIMGGHEIDLRPAKLSEGTATIDLFVWWGGVDLRVPEDWKVTSEVLPLMGGVDDTSKAPMGEIRGHLILKGLIVMGGVEIKN